jgi:ribosomal protein L20
MSPISMHAFVRCRWVFSGYKVFETMSKALKLRLGFGGFRHFNFRTAILSVCLFGHRNRTKKQRQFCCLSNDCFCAPRKNDIRSQAYISILKNIGMQVNIKLNLELITSLIAKCWRPFLQLLARFSYSREELMSFYLEGLILSRGAKNNLTNKKHLSLKNITYHK